MFQYGYAGKVLRVNLTKKIISIDLIEEDLIKKYIGGRGFAARYMFDELLPGIDPLGPENKLFLFVGPLQGTLTPFSSRFVVATKSPMSGTFTRSTCGGNLAPEVKYAGYDGLIVEGRSENPVYLFVDGEKIEIRDGKQFWGETTSKTEQLIKKEIGDDKVQVVSIGPAGEKLVKFACLLHESRAAGRGGTGAVLGSKNLKAIAFRGKSDAKLSDPQLFRELLKDCYNNLRTNPVTPIRRKLGTLESIEVTYGLGVMPIKNYSVSQLSGIEDILGDIIKEKMVVHDEACFACLLPCGNLSRIRKGPYKDYVFQGPQYESVALLGPNCGITDAETVTEANFLCNELGMDTISTGNVVGFAMECYEKGLIDKKITYGLELRFGRTKECLKIIEEIGNRERFGHVLAEGVKYASQAIGKGSGQFAMHSKGLEYSAFNPRSIVGMGLMFATANPGANHTYGSTFRMEKNNPLRAEGKAKIVRDNQNDYCLIDSMVICSFSRYAMDMNSRLKFLSSIVGRDFYNESEKIADRIYTLERAFNIREGFSNQEDTISPRCLEEPMPDGPSKGNVVPLSKMLVEYYQLRGWNVQTGIPTEETLQKLNLQDIISQISE